jgi:hypothetical protein
MNIQPCVRLIKGLIVTLIIFIQPTTASAELGSYGNNIWILSKPLKENGKFIAQKNSIVSKSILIAKEVVVLDDSISDPWSKNTLLDAGIFLVRSPHRSKTIPVNAAVYCTAIYGPGYGPQPDFVSLYNTAMVCAIDADNDGHFEGVYFVFSASSSLIIQSSKPLRSSSITPTPYHSVDRNLYKSHLISFITYDGQDSSGNQKFHRGISADSEVKTPLVKCIATKPARIRMNVGSEYNIFGRVFSISNISDNSITIENSTLLNDELNVEFYGDNFYPNRLKSDGCDMLF